MFQSFVRRILVALPAVVLATGCSNDFASMGPARTSLTHSAGQPGPAMRMLPGAPGPILVPRVPHPNSLPHIWPDADKPDAQILFVSDQANDQVLLYSPAKPNPKPRASIVDGISVPLGLAVDTHGALYVANGGNNTITVYAKGSSSPSLTIDQGLYTPYGVTVDSRGNVFASSPGNDTVLGYRPGAAAPFESFDFKKLGQPVGVASDGHDNIWVVCSNTNKVFEIPVGGASEPVNAHIPGLLGPIGISFGPKDVTYVSNYATGIVDVYAYRATTPFETITDGIETGGPTLNAVTRTGMFFQSNQDIDVVGYRQGETSPFSTIRGVTNPLGVAAYPLVKK